MTVSSDAGPARPRMAFVISAPRSGSTLLERMLEAHPMIHGGPEPHLLTPLAHLGVWAKVDKAPYDHILAAESQKLFVAGLPGGEQDYWDACRAYCDVLYGRALAASGRQVCLDKTPAYALILPFMARVFPDAAYVVLTRHPLATLSSYAHSFFDGSYRAAQEHNPLLERYVPALAAFLRQREVPFLHTRYEDLVKDPDAVMRGVCDHLGVPFDPSIIEYGNAGGSGRKGLGDPVGVDRQTRPTTGSLKKWVEDLASNPENLALARATVARLDPGDLRILGYPPETLWAPLDEALGRPVRAKMARLTRYRIQRKLIVGLRARARRGGAFRKLLETARLACDVLLRE
jgi:hypothetical protein